MATIPAFVPSSSSPSIPLIAPSSLGSPSQWSAVFQRPQQAGGPPRQPQNQRPPRPNGNSGRGKRNFPGGNNKPRARTDSPPSPTAGGSAALDRLVSSYQARIPGDSPEEIAAWIAERKRKFPTKENQANKLKDFEDRQERGEIMNESTPGGRRDGKRQKIDKKQGKQRKNRNSQEDRKAEEAKIPSSSAPVPVPVPVPVSVPVPQPEPPKDALSALIGYEDSSEDEENEKEKKFRLLEDLHKPESPVDEGEPEAESSKDRPVGYQEPTAEPPGQKAPPIRPAESKPTRACHYFLDNACQRGADCSFSHDPDHRIQALAKRQLDASNAQNAKSRKPRGGEDQGKNNGNSNGTRTAGGLFLPKPEQFLWRRLIHDEIQQEKSIILQCFRYFVRNNFLQPTVAAADTGKEGENQAKGGKNFDVQ